MAHDEGPSAEAAALVAVYVTANHVLDYCIPDVSPTGSRCRWKRHSPDGMVTMFMMMISVMMMVMMMTVMIMMVRL